MERKPASSLTKSLLFLVVTFAITYCCWIGLAANRELKYGSPLFMAIYILGGFGPTISPFVVLGLLDRRAMRGFLSRIVKLHIHPFWYAVVIGVVALLDALLLLLDGRTVYTLQPWYMIFPLFITMIIGGGLEELGWRGFLLDSLLAQKVNLLLCALGIGLVWAFWHLPLFYIVGVSQYGKSFTDFLIGVVGLSCILTPLYAATRSIFVCVFAHALFNASVAFGFDAGVSTRGSLLQNIIQLVVGVVCLAAFMAHDGGKRRARSA
jgi:membrane protease YdiL (CAAX protease family)